MRNEIFTWTIVPVTATLSETQINARLALLRLPSRLKLKVDYNQPYTIRTFSDCGSWPFPTKEGQVVLFNANKFDVRNAAALTIIDEKIASVSYNSNEALYIIIARIIHEILHVMLSDLSADQMCSNYAVEFGKYLKSTYGDSNAYADNFVKDPTKYEHSIMYEQDFYRFLLLKYFPEAFDNPVRSRQNRIMNFLLLIYNTCISLIKKLTN